MDISSLASAASSAGLQDGIATAVLKKAMSAQADSVAQLVNSVPESSGTNNPAHLGQSIDVKA